VPRLVSGSCRLLVLYHQPQGAIRAMQYQVKLIDVYPGGSSSRRWQAVLRNTRVDFSEEWFLIHRASGYNAPGALRKLADELESNQVQVADLGHGDLF
jgi:hypothetical protein